MRYGVGRIEAQFHLAGVEVTVKGYKAKSGAPKANGQSVTLKDGRNFFLGATEGGSTPQ